MDQSKNNDLDQFGAVEKPTAEDFQPYVDAGLALTIVAGKDCLLDKWNTRENAITTLDQLCQNFHAHPNYTGVGLLHAWSGTVAIDFDDLTKAIPYFAEHCPEFDVLAAIQNPNNVGIFSGRENRGKLIYRVDDALRFHTKNRSDKEGFEFRCATKKSTSVQDVLPPSIHPDTGKPYKLQGDITNIPKLPECLERHWMELLTPKVSHRPRIKIQGVRKRRYANFFRAPSIRLTQIVTTTPGSGSAWPLIQ